MARLGAKPLKLDFDRIAHLLSPEVLSGKKVVQVGLGSGGAPVCDHLTMNGVRNWVLYDPEILEGVNLVKHPRRRADLNKYKVEIQRDWILDRNPEAAVEPRAEDVFISTAFRNDVGFCDLLVCCADKRDVRLFVNSVAVELRKPCVTASVFRQGFGGEVHAYTPKTSGCFECMERASTEQGWNINDAIEPTSEEEQMIYGKSVRDFQASGLSMDIQTIALIQARMSLDILLADTTRSLPAIPYNWIIYYNRPIPKTGLGGFFRAQFFRTKPRRDCKCASQ